MRVSDIMETEEERNTVRRLKMDQKKTGELIKHFRTEKGLTQKQLADMINVSDKAVSKWECGNGCPDVSLLSSLAEVFGTDVQILLSGEINKNESEKGKMKKLKFYVCKKCGNIITATSEAAITCCGSKLEIMEPKKADESEMLSVEDTGGEWYISSEHSMTKEHYISFVAFLTDSSVQIYKQYPEWNLQLNIPLYRYGRLVWYCTKCGLFYQDVRRQIKKDK